MIRLTHALLLIIDISGYTDFIVHRAVSLEHAEQIISELLDAVAECGQPPLVLNKFEGDAALFFAESGDDRAAVAAVVAGQVGAMFDAFATARGGIAQARRGCGCDACQNVRSLRLKAFVHCGDVAIKSLRGFVELAGEDVIVLHRLLKNDVGEREYVLVTAAACALWPAAQAGYVHRATAEGVGAIDGRVLAPGQLPRPAPG